MPRFSSALLSFSPRSIGPWGDDLFRLDGATSQLVEGGSRLYWHVCPSGAEHGLARQISFVPVEAPGEEFIARSVVMLAALLFGNENELGLMRELHNLVETNDGLEVAPFWDLSDRDAEWFASHIGERMKVASTVLDENSSLTTTVCEMVSQWGLRIDRFEPVTVRA